MSGLVLVPNLLLIAGTGNNSGKTSMACRIIDQFSHKKVVSVKITPHFHETTPGLVLLSEKADYVIYEETNRDIPKDSSKMLKAGASRVFYAKVTDSSISEAFEQILTAIPGGTPVICESPSLRKYIEPGLLILMITGNKDYKRNFSELLKVPHVEFGLTDLEMNEKIPVNFTEGKWISWHY